MGTTRSSSKISFSPSPSHAGQAPCGALKLNRRGSISLIVKPLTGQANFSLKTMRPRGRVVAEDFGFGGVRLDRVGGVDVGEAVGEFQRGLEAFGEARADVLAHDQAIDDDLDVVLVFLVERGGFVDLVDLAVDADTGEARLLPLGHFLAVFALAPAHDGGEQVGARALGQRQDAIDHLADGLRGDRFAGRGAVGDADARPKQAHVVIDFGDGGDGRARVAAGRLLLDRDRRADSPSI